MSDEEYDLMAELYFLQSFADLTAQLEYPSHILQQTLKNLWSKGWIRCYVTASEEILDESLVDLDTKFESYYYIATKAGLLAHNSL
ncbi:hypothetical protein [Eisenibacter elegans]|jgi:hypothetical protein|uniref:hypothetical protein n=1 Tax=Eisenibacter elegans TaxID=997 RepID=UPI00042966AE|nr:hypothetical protein [Eisenibacter elegans]